MCPNTFLCSLLLDFFIFFCFCKSITAILCIIIVTH
jgi:hypothetical protein